MIKVKTRTGFSCNIDESIINKYSFVKNVSKIGKDPSVISEVIEKLLGDQEEKMIDHLGGDPTVEQIADELSDIFDAIKENNDAKKS